MCGCMTGWIAAQVDDLALSPLVNQRMQYFGLELSLEYVLGARLIGITCGGRAADAYSRGYSCIVCA